MTDEELKQLIESNARTAQAMLDTMAEARQEREELREGIQEIRVGMLQLQNVVERLTNIQEGVANLLAILWEHTKREKTFNSNLLVFPLAFCADS